VGPVGDPKATCLTRLVVFANTERFAALTDENAAGLSRPGRPPRVVQATRTGPPRARTGGYVEQAHEDQMIVWKPLVPGGAVTL
jgi:hypothetical protein